MKTRIQYSSLNKNSEPIVIENLNVFKNCVGQWVIAFDTVNHKYLEHDGEVSVSSWNDDGIFVWEKGITFNTYETFVPPEGDTWMGWDSFMRIDSNGGHFGRFRWSNVLRKVWFGHDIIELPNQKVEIFLIPETKEEQEEINGVFCVLPLKWQYQIVCVPFEHFNNPKYRKNQKEFEVVN